MTRAQIRIFSKLQHIAFTYGVNSDGYPDRLVTPLENFSGSILPLTEDLSLSISPAGNVDYYYDIDCDAATLTYWQSQSYWCNAPDNWEQLGWNCWEGENGKYGYPSWRKGKKLDTISISPHPITVLLTANNKYTTEDIKSYISSGLWGSWSLKILLKSSKDPNVFHTFIQGDDTIHDLLYKMPYEDIPIRIFDNNATDRTDILKWRLNVGK